MVDKPKVYKKRARLQLSKVEMEAYQPTSPGMSMRWYNWDAERMSVVLELIACDGMPNPLECRTMEDIDKEFEKLRPRIIEDNPHVPNLVTGQDIRIESNLHTPSYRNSRFDSLIDKVKDSHKITLKPEALAESRKFYRRRRALFGGKYELEDIKENKDGSAECDFGTVFEG
jgi:hypothetical protein